MRGVGKDPDFSPITISFGCNTDTAVHVMWKGRKTRRTHGIFPPSHVQRHTLSTFMYSRNGGRFSPWSSEDASEPFPSGSGQLPFDGRRVLGGYGVGAAALFECLGGERVGARHRVAVDPAVQLNGCGL